MLISLLNISSISETILIKGKTLLNHTLKFYEALKAFQSTMIRMFYFLKHILLIIKFFLLKSVTDTYF